MEIKMINDKREWNDFLLAQPSQAGVFLQSWEWGEFQRAMGRKVYRYQSGDTFAQAIELSLPFGKKYWFIPRGSLIPGISDEARKRGALFIRCEPVGEEKLQEVTGGYKKLQEVAPIHPKQTLILDLFKSEDDLLTGMHEKTRYNIRLAERKGVRCEVVGISGFEDFWKLMEETTKRDKFSSHPREYYEKMLEVLNNSSQPPLNLRGGEDKQHPPLKVRGGAGGVMNICLWIAYHSTTPIAGAIVGYFGDTATYLHGASSYEHRALMGPYALHWDIIKNAKKQGYKFYDFWGVDEKKWPGITRFKMGFNGKIVNYPGTFDLPLSKFWYKVYRFGRRLLP